jgi:hypothetical protein
MQTIQYGLICTIQVDYSGAQHVDAFGKDITTTWVSALTRKEHSIGLNCRMPLSATSLPGEVVRLVHVAEEFHQRGNIGMELLNLIVKYGVTFAWGVWAGYVTSYLKKKGENLAIHEDIDKLLDQVSVVTTATKQIEAKISNETWQRERRSDLQLKAIDTVNVRTSEFIQSVMRSVNDNAVYWPTNEWFSAFDVAGATVKALFDQETYAVFQNLEKRIGQNPKVGGWTTFPVNEFVEAREAAINAMYRQVIG